MQEYEKYGNNCMQIAKGFSTQTPVQIEKHAECFFKQNFKTNSAAVKRYWESLSPNGKAQVLINDSAAHLKQQQFFSQEDKAQILCKDADAQKNQQESLSLDDKVQILTKNADAHKMKQDSLSAEDKDLFARNNTAAQHKYCKALSLDQNAEVLTIDVALSWTKSQIKSINAAAHKKQYELLPLEIKARLMEAKAEQQMNIWQKKRRKFPHR